MLNHIAIHIHDPQRSVHPRTNLHGTKPGIRRRQKLTIKLILSTPTRKRGGLRNQNLSMNEVIDGLAGKCILRIFAAQQIVSPASQVIGTDFFMPFSMR